MTVEENGRGQCKEGEFSVKVSSFKNAYLFTMSFMVTIRSTGAVRSNTDFTITEHQA